MTSLQPSVLVLEASTLSEGCKPEYWFGGEGGHRFYVCPSVRLSVCLSGQILRIYAQSLSPPYRTTGGCAT
jgi:hypothetical protein